MVTRPLDRSMAVMTMAIRRRLVLESVVSKMVKSVVIFGMSGVNGGEKPFGRDFSHSIHPLTSFLLFGEGIARYAFSFRTESNGQHHAATTERKLAA